MNQSSDRLARCQSTKVRRLFPALLLVLVVPALVAAQATKVSSTEGRYTAIFPGPANRIVEPPKTVNGLTYSVEYYRAVIEQQIFMTAFTHYTGGEIDIPKELRLNVDNLVKGLSGRLLSTKPIDYVSSAQKIAGIEFICETNQFTFHGRFYAAGTDVWGIVYGAPPQAGSAAVKEQFFRSFEISAADTKGDHR